MTIYNDYYVYAYLRNNGVPYYIGKGRRNRMYVKHGSIGLPPKDRIVILEKNLTELGAFAIERRMIKWYGKLIDNTGVLRNITDGGTGGDTTLSPNYQKYIENLRDKIAHGIYIPADKGTKKPRSKESIEKQRKSITGKKRGTYSNYNYAASSKRIEIYGTIYNTIEDAKKATGHSYTTVMKYGRLI